MDPFSTRILDTVGDIGSRYGAVPSVDTLAGVVIEALGPVRTIAAFRRLIKMGYRPSQIIGLPQPCLAEKGLWLAEVLDSVNESERNRTKPCVHRLPRRKADLIQLLPCIARGSPRQQGCRDVLASIRLYLQY